jgi:RTX calcium-binding nonapeptide repeat (4 copies)
LAAAMAFASAASALPTTDVSYSNGVLFISGSFEQDLITVSVDGSNFKVTEAAPHPITTNPPCMPSGLQAVSCPQDPPDDPSPAPPKPPITALSVSLGAGDDSLTNLTSLGTPVLESPQSGDLTLDGNDGNDVIRGGPAAETIVGGIGNDDLDGGGGDDTLLNGVQSFGCNLGCDGGFSRLARSEFDGSDNYVGGPGDDVTRFDARQDNLTITLDGLANDGHPGENDNVQTESVVGGSGGDSITGDAGPNTLVGGPGNDTLSGLRGADRLEGGRNNDSLVGGRARDQMQCESGFDLAVSTPIDSVAKDCERTGAKLGSDTGRVRNGRTRVWVSCPSAEGARCQGRFVLREDKKRFGAGSFRVNHGKVKAFVVALTPHGRSVLRRRRSFQVNARIRTNEPLGLAVAREKLLLTH